MARRSGSPECIRLAKEDLRASPPGPRRRGFLRRAAAAGGSAKNLAPNVPEWTRKLGAPALAFPYGGPSKRVVSVGRRVSPGTTRAFRSPVTFTPRQDRIGIITPSGLHFERHHGSGRRSIGERTG